jgi:hypothetical protein
MNLLTILSILSVFWVIFTYSITGVSEQTMKEQERSANIIRGQFVDDWQKRDEVRKEVLDSKLVIRSEKEADLTTLIKIWDGNADKYGVGLTIMSINDWDGRLLYLDQNSNPLDIVITLEPAFWVLKKVDRNRLFTIGYNEKEFTNKNISSWMSKNVLDLDLDALYKWKDSNDWTNMIRAKWYNSFRFKWSWYNVRLMFNKDVFYQIEKDDGVEIKNLDLLNKDLWKMSDFSIGNNHIYQFQ